MTCSTHAGLASGAGRAHRNPKKSEELPHVISKIGARALKYLQAKALGNSWVGACTDISGMPQFEQAFVQRYTEGQSLGFHFDNRTG